MKSFALVVALAFFPACDSRAQHRSQRVHREYESEIAKAVEEAKSIYPVPPSLVLAVIQQESSFRPHALSPVGARGLMQVMPGNAQRLGVTPEDLWDPTKNIMAGTRLLATLLDHYRGDVISALVAYNARPRPRFAPVPRNGETPKYVWGVLAFFEQYSCGESRVCDPDRLAAGHERLLIRHE